MATKTHKAMPTGRPASARKAAPHQKPRSWIWGTVLAVVALGVLFVIFRSNTAGTDTSGRHTAYQVGSPGIGQQAPDFDLPASTGGSMSLQSLRGKSVLLYFQEGVGCQPCWKQMKDLEAAASAVRAAGIDRIVSITTQPVNLLTQKAHDEGISTPVLADTSLAVSRAYTANDYGMMGDSMDGHTFVLVGPDGTIQWRADYGGAPKYTMYVTVEQLLADLKAARRA